VPASPSRGIAATGSVGLVAKRLRQAREELGLSQRELGVRAGLDPSVASPRINQYEQNKHAPNIAVLGQLAVVLQRPLAYFYAADEDLAELVTTFHRSSARERQRLMTSIRS